MEDFFFFFKDFIEKNSLMKNTWQTDLYLDILFYFLHPYVNVLI